MAKRFGRNQRRKMRQQIETLEVEKAHVEKIYGQARDRAWQLEQRLYDWAREIRHLLGDNSAFNEQLRRYRMDPWQDTLMLQPVISLDIHQMKDSAPQIDSVPAIIEALIFRARSKNFENIISIEIVGPDGTLVGYGLTKDRCRDWSPRTIEATARMIAIEMARYLAVN